MSETNTPVPVPEPVAAAPVPAVADVPGIDLAADASPSPAEPVAPDVSATEPEKPFYHADEPGLLNPKEGEVPEQDAVQVEATPEPVIYELQWADGVVAQPEQVEALVSVFRENNITPEVGQRLVDMHNETIRQHAVSSLERQQKTFSGMRQDWQGRVKADPELGGAGLQTTLDLAFSARDAAVKNAQERAEWDEMLAITGVTDHPAMIRYLSRIGRMLAEATTPAPNARPTPQAAPNGRRGNLTDFFRNAPSSVVRN